MVYFSPDIGLDVYAKEYPTFKSLPIQLNQIRLPNSGKRKEIIFYEI